MLLASALSPENSTADYFADAESSSLVKRQGRFTVVKRVPETLKVFLRVAVRREVLSGFWSSRAMADRLSVPPLFRKQVPWGNVPEFLNRRMKTGQHRREAANEGGLRWWRSVLYADSISA